MRVDFVKYNKAQSFVGKSSWVNSTQQRMALNRSLGKETLDSFLNRHRLPPPNIHIHKGHIWKYNMNPVFMKASSSGHFGNYSKSYLNF